jgi:hypothetical protein
MKKESRNPGNPTETSEQKELRSIRDTVDEVRGQIDRASAAPPPKELRSLAWKCAGCGHIKHFTRPMPIDVAPPCPKCQGTQFQPG